MREVRLLFDIGHTVEKETAHRRCCLPPPNVRKQKTPRSPCSQFYRFPVSRKPPLPLHLFHLGTVATPSSRNLILPPLKAPGAAVKHSSSSKSEGGGREGSWVSTNPQQPSASQTEKEDIVRSRSPTTRTFFGCPITFSPRPFFFFTISFGISFPPINTVQLLCSLVNAYLHFLRPFALRGGVFQADVSLPDGPFFLQIFCRPLGGATSPFFGFFVPLESRPPMLSREPAR